MKISQKQVDILKAAPLDDGGTAQCVLALYLDQFLHCPQIGWMSWTGTHWERAGAPAAIKNAIKDTLRHRAIIAFDNGLPKVQQFSIASRHRITGALFILQSELTEEITAFDNEPFKLNVKNGVINLTDGVLYRHHRKTHRFTYCIPYEYHPGTDTSIIEEHYKEDLANPADMVPFLQRAFGYSLTGSTREEILFYCYGPARSGKDTGIGAFHSMIGEPLGRGIEFATLTEKRYGDTNRADIATLRQARSVIASESDRSRAMNAATIKNQTGGNEQFVAMKGKDHFSFTPQYKPWLTSNWPIDMDVTDDAAWGRVILIDFPNGHLGNANPARKEATKSEKFRTALLAWSVTGAQEWIANGLQIPACSEASKEEHRGAIGSPAEFINACVTKDIGSEVVVSTMYETYDEWCANNGATSVSKTAFGREMKARKILQKQKRDPLFPAGRYRAWINVKLTI